MKRTIQRLLTAALAPVMLTGCGWVGSVGRVSTDGSSSMEKVVGILKETFEERYEGITVSYNPTGSSSGIMAVSEGRCEIGLSSRALKEEEKAWGLTGTVLAYDGIAVLINPNNPAEDLSMEQLAAIFTGEADNWSQFGGENAAIVRIGREAGSGTREGFESAIGTEDRCRYGQELTSTGDVVTAVASNPWAIGYASLDSVRETVKVLSVDGVVPSEETVRDGSYAIRRPFLLVTREGEALSESAQLFFDFITSERAREWISSAGVVPAN